MYIKAMKLIELPPSVRKKAIRFMMKWRIKVKG